MQGLSHHKSKYKSSTLFQSFNILPSHFAIPLMATVGLFAGGIAFLNPFSFIESSYADSEDFGTTVNVASNLSVSATDITITDTPEASGSWLTGTSNVVVSTNNATGYKLYISSNDDQVDLINSENSKYKISNLSSETTETNFKNSSDLMNHYGFTTNNNGSDAELGQITAGTYLPLTDNNNARLINATTEKKNISQTDVTFATKVDRSIPAGEYTNTITFTAIANPVTTPITNDMYLQDITPQMCADTPVYNSSNATETTFTVKDQRDNQSYRIRRLYMTTENIDSPSTTACWMVDNLKLTKDTIESAGNNAKLSSNTSNVADNNEFELTASDDSTWCTSNNSDCDDKSMLIDTNYGTLYNWYAATAGTGTYSSGSEVVATASICPGRGVTTSSTWHLPTGNTDNEWYQLFQAYQSDYGWSDIAGSGNSTTNNLNTTIGLDLVYSGFRNGASTSGQSSTGRGYWWSSTAYGYGNAYRASINNNGVVFGGADLNSKYYGFAVRCILPATTN